MKNRPASPVVRRPASPPPASRSQPAATARHRSHYLRALTFALGVIATTGAGSLKASPADDAKAVAALDTAFQAAVKANDAATIARLLAPDMVLVTGRGKVFTAADHVEAAKTRARTYEQQDEIENSQKVRVHGDTAIVTALLWLKGADKDGKAFDYKVWFSDTYVRTAQGWKYVFGQSSIPLPKES